MQHHFGAVAAVCCDYVVEKCVTWLAVDVLAREPLAAQLIYVAEYHVYSSIPGFG